MKKASMLYILAASLFLVTGCYENDTTYPNVPGYDGMITDGWENFQAGDYAAAMQCFLDAIEVDVSRPEAYLGAGWCSVVLPDYWVIGDQYDYMAVQQDGGSWPIGFVSESQTQDMDWTVFQCIDPVLTANDMMVLGAYGDTILIVEGDTLFWGGETGPDSLKGTLDNLEIGDWLYDQYGAVPFKYTFEIDDPNVQAIFRLANGFALNEDIVDSLVNGATSTTVYLHVPYLAVEVAGSPDYRTWIMNENILTYEYATYTPPAGNTSIAGDGVAAYGLLQHARGINGDLHRGVATLLGLADEGAYTFEYFSGITNLKLKGMAAAMAYANTEFRFALYVCRSEGFAMGLSVDDPDFVVELGQAIEQMLI